MANKSTSISFSSRLAERDPPIKSAVMYQRWEELLFIHWPVEVDELAQHLPPGLRVDTYNGKAWIGIVPFTMCGVRPRFLPSIPGISTFPELNVRTYVIDGKGRPGVWFFSLDTPKRIPNWIARTFFHLNYRLARMCVKEEGSWRTYHSELCSQSGMDETQEYIWKRKEKQFLAEPSTLEFFLVERYRLFAYSKTTCRLLTGKVHHEPYPLQAAELVRYTKGLFTSNDLLQPKGDPASVLASSGVKVRIFPMEVVT